MKIPLAKIPEEGMRQVVRIPAEQLTRLVEAVGSQSGTLEADTTLRNRAGNVTVTGAMTMTVQLPCQRCLDPQTIQVSESVGLRLVPLHGYKDSQGETILADSDLELSYYEGEEIDLAHYLEDELLLALPESVADTDDQDRCLICGKSLEDLYAGDNTAMANHPMAQLRQFVKTDSKK